MRRTLTLGLFGSLLLLPLAGSQAVAKPATWKIDPVHSAILFKVRHINAGYVWGRFNEFSGAFVLDGESAKNCSVKVAIDVNSVDTANKDRDAHLRHADFFDVAKHPGITFESTAVEVTEEAYTVTGTFTMHGVSKAITFPMKRLGTSTHPQGGTRMGLEGNVTIKRSEFGMSNSLDAIGDEVQVILAIEAVPGS